MKKVKAIYTGIVFVGLTAMIYGFSIYMTHSWSIPNIRLGIAVTVTNFLAALTIGTNEF